MYKNIKDNTKEIINISVKGLISYLRGQLKLLFITFVILYLGFNYLKVSFPFLIALGVSMLDLIPIIGIGLILIPWAIISYLLGNTFIAIGLSVLFIVTVVVRQILEPIIIGKSIGINPLYTLLITILGSMILGPIGIILAPVITIIMVAIFNVLSKNKK